MARVNGQVWTEADSSNLFWTFPRLIEYMWPDETRFPGESIGSGAAAFAPRLEPGRWLKSGAVELEMVSMGALQNPVGQPAPRR